jgi:quercetin dioxygenase-like cupin family protein
MKAIDLTDQQSFDPEAKVSKLVFDSDQVRLALFCSESGQGVEGCTSTSRVSFTILEGEGEFFDGENLIEAGPGSVVVWEPGETHGYKALSRLVFLATIAPRPG